MKNVSKPQVSQNQVPGIFHKANRMIRAHRWMIAGVFGVLLILLALTPFVMRKYYRTLYKDWPNDRQLPIIGGCPALFVDKQQDDGRTNDMVYHYQSDLMSNNAITVFGIYYVLPDMGKWKLIMDAPKQYYPTICRTTITDIRYLNLFPGEAARTDMKRIRNAGDTDCWTHDMLLEMRIDKIFFDGNQFVDEGDTVTVYALEMGGQSKQYIDSFKTKWEEGFYSFNKGFIPDDVFPYYRIGDSQVLYLYKTEWNFDSSDPYDVTIRALSDYYVHRGVSLRSLKYHLDFGERFPDAEEFGLELLPSGHYSNSFANPYQEHFGKTRDEMYAIDDVYWEGSESVEKIRACFEQIDPEMEYILYLHYGNRQ